MGTNVSEDEPDMRFSKELRAATKDVHKLSDVLINAKFALALSDDGVWADGLLSFYEVYKYLEANLPEELLPKELHRTAAFERDLAFFLGDNWKESYEPRESVKNYIEHLKKVNAKSKKLLFAYAYQMYMAIMSGGQLVQKKRMIARKLRFSSDDDDDANAREEIIPANPDADPNDLEARPMPKQVTTCPDGCAATYFPEKITILKAKLRNILNKLEPEFDAQMREEFFEESRQVFRNNIVIVRDIKGVNSVYLRKLAVGITIILTIYVAWKCLQR